MADDVWGIGIFYSNQSMSNLDLDRNVVGRMEASRPHSRMSSIASAFSPVKWELNMDSA